MRVTVTVIFFLEPENDGRYLESEHSLDKLKETLRSEKLGDLLLCITGSKRAVIDG